MKRILALVVALLPGLMTVLPAEAQQTYRVRAGDVLRVEVLEDPALNRSVIVAPDGRISMPLAGVFVAAGRPLEAVQADLAQRLAPNFAAPPNVFISLERLGEQRNTGPAVAAAPPTISIFIMGEGAKQGALELPVGATLLQAFSQMGGFSKFAATKRIQLRRADPKTRTEKIYSFNYDAIVRGENRSGLTTLTDGDIILVPQRRLFE
ncbi:polysaccharide export protein [Tabrizicola sp. WMC-M-20]|nr:polysaccharide export protein [Tabrizicola sp. WMC-M-20]